MSRTQGMWMNFCLLVLCFQKTNASSRALSSTGTSTKTKSNSGISTTFCTWNWGWTKKLIFKPKICKNYWKILRFKFFFVLCSITMINKFVVKPFQTMHGSLEVRNLIFFLYKIEKSHIVQKHQSWPELEKQELWKVQSMISTSLYCCLTAHTQPPLVYMMLRGYGESRGPPATHTCEGI